jgi:outer membrane receptor for ferrienterochelin and colicins
MAVSGFYNNISNKIDWVLYAAPFPPDTYQYFNLKHYITYGGQGSLTYQWNSLQIGAAVLFTGYQLSNTSKQTDKVTMWSPDFKATASYLIPKAELNISIQYKYTGIKPLFSVSNSIETGTRSAYHWLDVSISRNFWKDRIQLTVGGKNLVGVKDITGKNVSGVSLAHDATPNTLNIGWGRTFFATLVLHFSR